MILQDKVYDLKDSKFYATKNAKKGDIVKIKTEPVWKNITYKDGKSASKLVCMISVSRGGVVQGIDKEYTMNNYASDFLKETYGGDTADWIDGIAQVVIIPTPVGKAITLETADVDTEKTPF